MPVADIPGPDLDTKAPKRRAPAGSCDCHLHIFGDGIVRANSFTLPKRQNRISWSLIFLHFSGRSERFDGCYKYLEFYSDNARQRAPRSASPAR
jgi:hypothetical protein